MKGYNGHKNWNHWNVSLWINNDEELYRLAKLALAGAISREQAAGDLMGALRATGMTHTPDGAPYSKTAIRAAMVGM